MLNDATLDAIAVILRHARADLDLPRQHDVEAMLYAVEELLKKPEAEPKINRNDVIRLYKDGKTPKQIAEYFGCSEQTARNWIKKIGMEAK